MAGVLLPFPVCTDNTNVGLHLDQDLEQLLFTVIYNDFIYIPHALEDYLSFFERHNGFVLLFASIFGGCVRRVFLQGNNQVVADCLCFFKYEHVTGMTQIKRSGGDTHLLACSIGSVFHALKNITRPEGLHPMLRFTRHIMQQHFFFDLDNTLTPSKSLIQSEYAPLYAQLCATRDVVVVSGHGVRDIRAHLAPACEYGYVALGQNGNTAEDKDGNLLWNNALSQEQKSAIYAFITKVRAYLNYTVRDEDDIIEDRDSQIAFSLIGHHEDKAKKDAFDPDHEIRVGVLKTFAEDVQALQAHNVEVRIGGSTNLDFFTLGRNKGYNVRALLENMNWSADSCVYVGDALFPGGNDETVIGILPTRSVKNPDETFSFIREVLS